ncbi:MAG: hypothetical protein ACT4P1_06745 [Sporichthyaceae bacterium]
MMTTPGIFTVVEDIPVLNVLVAFVMIFAMLLGIYGILFLPIPQFWYPKWARDEHK